MISSRPDHQPITIPPKTSPNDIVVSHWMLKVVKIGGVSLVIPLAAMIAWLVANDHIAIAFLLAGLPIAILILLKLLVNFHLSPAIVLALAIYVPFTLPTGTGSRLVICLVATVLFAGFWMLRILTKQSPFALSPASANLPIIGFNVIVILSLAWSIGVRDPTVIIWSSFVFVQIASAGVMIASAIALWLVSNWVKSENLLKIMAYMMIAAGFLALPNYFFNTPLLVNSQGMFNMWVCALAGGQLLFNKRLPRFIQAAFGLLVAAIAFYGFGLHRDWLAGWVPVFIAIGVLAVQRSLKLGILIGVVLIVLFSVFYLGPSLESETRVSGVTRLAAWEMNWRVTSQHLMLGTGPGGYAAYYMTYFPTQAMATHSNYIDIVAQLGIFGFVFFVWIFVATAWSGFRLSRRLHQQGDFQEGLVNAALAGTIGCIFMMGFGDWVIPFAYTQSIAGFSYSVYNWLFIGTIFAISRLAPPKVV